MQRLAAANALVASVLFACLTAIVALQVVTRFVLHLPFIWSEEAARFLFFWVALLGSAMSVRTRRHFAVDLTMGRSSRSGPGMRLLLAIVPDLCVLGFTLFLVVQGIGYARTGAFRTATNSGINMAFVYGAIPVFALLSVIYSVSNLARDVIAARTGTRDPPLPPPAE